MEGTTSVSKGIFVFKNSKSSQFSNRKKKNYKHAEFDWMNEPWYAAYRKAWQYVEQQVKELFEEIFSKLLTDVTLYFKNYNRENTSVFTEIPTAVILSGINLPDHSILFSSLEKRLRRDVSPHVVLLSSRSCPKVRTMLGHILQHCQNGSQADQSLLTEVSESEDEDEDLESYGKCRRVTPCTFSELTKWYTNQYGNVSIPIVVVITDFESFQSQVLEDFIHISSEYQDKVPLFLVFGVATTVTAIHATLPHRVMSRLSMQTFVTQNSNTLLNQLVDKVILSPHSPFRIGGSVFGMLSDIFIFYDFSIQSYLQRFKFCMLSHYRKHGIALSSWNRKEIQVWVSKLEEKQLEEIRKLASFRTYIQSQSAHNKKALLSNEQYFKDNIVELILNFMKHFTFFLVGLKCLQELSKDLPGTPVGKFLGNLYKRSVSNPIGMTEEFRKCEDLWGNLSKTGLEIHLRNIINILKEAKRNHREFDHDILDQWITKLKSENKRLKDLEKKHDKCPSPQKSSKVQELKKITSRTQMSEQLKELAHTAPELNQFENIRSEILQTLEQMLGGGKSSLLRPPIQLPLHELVLFEESASVVREELIGSSRSMLHSVLADPHSYLKCNCCKLNDIGDICPNMPDICIAYKLHLECGKHINLYDWMQSFNQVVNPQNVGDDGQIDTVTQSRFSQAVSELQFLGFVKPTTRKADHVIRLTYGHS